MCYTRMTRIEGREGGGNYHVLRRMDSKHGETYQGTKANPVKIIPHNETTTMRPAVNLYKFDRGSSMRRYWKRRASLIKAVERLYIPFANQTFFNHKPVSHKIVSGWKLRTHFEEGFHAFQTQEKKVFPKTILDYKVYLVRESSEP